MPGFCTAICRLDDLLQSFSNEGSCRLQTILEGVFIFQLTKEGSRFNTHHSCNYSNGIGHNPYAYVLHDSVWALILSVDTRSISEASLLFYSKSDSSNAYVHHYLNSSASLVGIYNDTSCALTNIREIIFMDYDLPVVKINTKVVLVPNYLLLLPILCFIFNTILLVLYIVFRNQPSIKSTSVSFSMLMFTGCYILIGYSICLLVVELYQISIDLCMTLFWLSGIGLSLPLIFAAILVKMLRVYHIFTAHKILKRSAHLSDFALLVYVLLILSPNIVVLILWTAIDPVHRIETFIEHPRYIENRVQCHGSNYDLIWFALTLSYVFLLSAAVVIVAIKSRNIRLAQFKDTKKINLLIFLLYIFGLSTFSYWKILSDSGFVALSFIILYSGHTLMAFICQIVLFVPKIWPVIQKKIIHHGCKH